MVNVNPNQDGRTYTYDERLYLNKAGEVVGDGDPDKLTLLVAAGSSISFADALKYGLIDAEGNEIERDVKAKASGAKKAAPDEAPVGVPVGSGLRQSTERQIMPASGSKQ